MRHPRCLLKFLMLFAAFAMMFAGLPPTISAHASLAQAVPEADSQWNSPPEQVSLSFNEPVESDLFQLNVLDSSGKSLVKEKAKLSVDRKTVSLELPLLKEGIYTVAYHVVSADGHPVEGAYVFTVGQAAKNGSVPQFPIEGHELHEGNHAAHTVHRVHWNMSIQEYNQYAVRIGYYAVLLLFAGCVLWYAFFARIRESLRTDMKKRLLQIQRVHLIFLLLYIFVHGWNLTGGEDAGQWVKLFTQTQVGWSWLVSVCIALLGFVVLTRTCLIDLVWVAGLLGAKTMTGHSAAYEPAIIASLLNFIHLSASAVWVGGVFLLFAVWKRHPEYKEASVSAVSRAAFLSIVFLAASGLALTLVFIPRFSYLFYTQWGYFLLLKSALVAMVTGCAFIIRTQLKRKGNILSLLKAEALLMALIIGIVGIFTYISPLPANEPVHWHEMGETIHMTTEITPNVPGTNEFILKVWLPENAGAPKNAELKLRPLDSDETAAIKVPLKTFKDEGFDSFTGFDKYTYKAQGTYLPYPGKWQIEVRVMDPGDNETVYKKEIMVY